MTREEAIKTAQERICDTSRDYYYGKPENSFKAIAKLWSAYKDETTFSETDVAIMMALLKIARIKRNHEKDDSFVDLIGYAACAAEVSERSDKEIFEATRLISPSDKNIKVSLDHPDLVAGSSPFWNGIDGLNS